VQTVVPAVKSALDSRLVHRDEKFPAAMHAPRRSEENHISWPIMYDLLLAVWALDQVPIETEIDEIDFRHDLVPGSKERMVSCCSHDGLVSVR